MDALPPHDLLKAWREKAGFSKAEAARKVETERATWLRWEKGTRKVGLRSLPKVQEVTGIPKRELRPDLAEALNEVAAA